MFPHSLCYCWAAMFVIHTPRKYVKFCKEKTLYILITKQKRVFIDYFLFFSKKRTKIV